MILQTSYLYCCALLRSNQREMPSEATVGLYEAAFRGDSRLVEKLLGNGQDPNLTIHHGLTPLHSACMNGNLKCAQALTEKGAHVESIDAAGLTPLHYASINGYLQVVKWLIEDADASPMVTSKKGRTPRVYAKKHGHNKVALFLAEIENKLEGRPWLVG